jgi:hypothetical protein
MRWTLDDELRTFTGKLHRGLHPVARPQILFPLIAPFTLARIWVTALSIIRVEDAAAAHAAAASTSVLLSAYEAQVVRNLRAIDLTLNLVKFLARARSGAHVGGSQKRRDCCRRIYSSSSALPMPMALLRRCSQHCLVPIRCSHADGPRPHAARAVESIGRGPELTSPRPGRPRGRCDVSFFHHQGVRVGHVVRIR